MLTSKRSPFSQASLLGGGILASLVLLTSNCTTTDPYTGQPVYSKTTIGAGAGVAAGAILGAVIGNNTGDGDQTKGAIIGASIGGLGGAGVGQYMDRQEGAIREQLRGTGVSVTRQGNNIILNMPHAITFDVARDELRGDFYPVLNSVVTVLRKFDRTMVTVNGHTDSDGSDAYNQDLSVRRATSVSRYLASQGVHAARLVTQGYGEGYPVADNMSAVGKAQNRRVEIHIVPQQQQGQAW